MVYVDGTAAHFSSRCRYLESEDSNIENNAYFHSVLSYGIIFLGDSSAKENVSIIQKRVIRMSGQLKNILSRTFQILGLLKPPRSEQSLVNALCDYQ